jgi:hypothetical protein
MALVTRKKSLELPSDQGLPDRERAKYALLDPLSHWKEDVAIHLEITSDMAGTATSYVKRLPPLSMNKFALTAKLRAPSTSWYKAYKNLSLTMDNFCQINFSIASPDSFLASIFDANTSFSAFSDDGSDFFNG